MRIAGIFIGIFLFVAISARPEPQDDLQGDQQQDGALSDRDLQQIQYPTRYHQRKTYIYKYNAQILTGVPQTASHYTGHKLLAEVKLAIREKRQVHMKFDKITILQTNRVLPVDLPLFVLPRGLFTYLEEPKVAGAFKKFLKLPISFKWFENGTIGRIATHLDDEYWSVNIKKAVISMLNVDMDVDVDKIKTSNGVFKDKAEYEDGIDGQCRSKYSYKQFPYTLRVLHHSGNLITVVKSRDLQQCKVFPWMQHALFPSQQCDKTRQPVTAQTQTTYNATKLDDQFFLRQMTTVSKYQYTPESREKGSSGTFVVQQLRFHRYIDQVKVELESDKRLRHKEGLRMILPIQEMRLIKESSELLRKQAQESLRLLEKKYLSDDIEMYDHMRRLVETLRKMSVKDIHDVITSQLKQTADSSLKSRKVLLELLPKVATKQAVQVIVDLVKERRLKDEETATLVSRLGGMTFISHDVMVTKLIETAKEIKSKKQRQTYKSLILTSGQLINIRYNRPVPQQQMRQGDHPSLTRPYIRDFYTSLLTRRNKILEKSTLQLTVALSLGNCRLVDPCLDILAKQFIPITKRVSDAAVRVQAVAALADFAEVAPQRVRNLTMPIYLDDREDEQLRLMSYFALIRSRPSQTDLRIIAGGLIQERSKQVRGLVQTHLKALSELTQDRCYSDLAFNVSRVLDDNQEELFGAQHSKVESGSFQALQKILVGAIFTPRSFLPRETGLQMVIQALGLNIELSQFAVNLNETQQLLQKLLGPDGTLRLATSLKDVLVQLDQRKSKDLDVNFNYIIKLYEGFYSFGGLSTEVTKQLLNGSIPLAKNILDFITNKKQLQGEFQRALYADKISKIATSFGASFSVNHTLTGHVKLNANVTLPNLSSKRVSAELSLQHQASFQQQFRTGADLGILSAFVESKSYIQLPKSEVSTIKAQVRLLDRVTRIRLNVNRPTQTRTALKLESRLQALQKTILRGKPESSEKTIKHRSLPEPQQQQKQILSLPSVGLSLRVDKRVLNTTGIADFVNLPFYGPAEFKVVIERDLSVGKYRSIDVTARYTSSQSSIKDIVDEVFETQDSEQQRQQQEEEESTLSKSAQDQLVRQVKRVRREKLVTELRLRNFTISQERRSRHISPISRFQVEIAQKKEPRVIVARASFEQLRGQSASLTVSSLSKVNKEIQRMRFDQDEPLKIEKDAKVQSWLSVKKDQSVILRSTVKGTVSDSFRKTIQRIKVDKKKTLLSFPDIQTCQEEISRRPSAPDCPACRQAWRDINAISQVQWNLTVDDTAPLVLKKIPLAIDHLLNSLTKRRESSNLTKTVSQSGQKMSLDLQVSPYDQKVFTASLSALNHVDRYVDAQSLVSLKNSFTQSVARSVLSNIFQGRYPAKCQVVSKSKRIQIRTFDGVDIKAKYPLQKQGGRIVLVQDIHDRLHVSEQQSIRHRVTYIRLSQKGNHVLIATRKDQPDEIVVQYKGEKQSLPFELKNQDGKVVLKAVQESTVFSEKSVSVYLPLLGSVIRTHPLVSTEIEVDPFFQYSVRGLCGDFDGEMQDEAKGPMCHNLYTRPKDLVKTYTTVLAKVPTLKGLENTHLMTESMATAQCPRGRYYITLR